MLKKLCVLWISLCVTWQVMASQMLVDVWLHTEPNARVVDVGQVLSHEEEQALTQKVQKLDETHAVQVAVVTIPSVREYSIQQVAFHIADEWQVWHEQNDSGIVVLVAVEERQRRIETWYGIEWDIPDILAQRMWSQFLVPAFREGRYSVWLSDLVDAFGEVMAWVYEPNSSDIHMWDDMWRLFVLGFASLLVALVLRWVLDTDEKNRKLAAGIGPWVTWFLWLVLVGFSGAVWLYIVMSFLWSLIMLAQDVDYVGSNNLRSWSWWSTRGWWSFGWWFSGFGWGSFGGGGASGSW